MKILLRFAPILAGLAACGIVGAIGVMLSLNDTSGLATKIVGLGALVVAVVVFLLVKSWADKRTPQEPK